MTDHLHHCVPGLMTGNGKTVNVCTCMIISDNSIWKTSGQNIVKIHSTSRKIQGVKCGKSQIIFIYIYKHTFVI